MNKLWYLKRCDIFQGLDKKSFDKIDALTKDRNVPKKEIIYRPEDKNEKMFILKKGRVRIFKISPDGKMMTLAILKDSDIFGSMAKISRGVTNAYAETLEDSYICAIRQEDFQKLISDMPQVALSLIKKINQRLKEAEDRIEDLVFRDTPGRIASIILKLAEQFGETKTKDKGIRISFKITHQELADMIGSTRETVTIILNDFKKDNIIDIDKKYITIIDEETLRKWAGK